MALEKRSLCMAGSVPYANSLGRIAWYRYVSADAVATVIAAGYFNTVRDKLAVGDTIDATCVLGGTADRVSVLVTAAPASGNVTVAVNTDATGA